MPVFPKTGRPVWTVGIKLETSRLVDVFPTTPTEAVSFEVQEVVGAARTGATDLIDVIIGDEVGPAWT